MSSAAFSFQNEQRKEFVGIMRNFHRFSKTGTSIFLVLALFLSLFTGCSGKADIVLDADLNVGGRELLTKTYTISNSSGKANTGISATADLNYPDEVDPMNVPTPEPTIPPAGTDSGAKLIALTFDDGPVGATEEFVQSLNELDVDCTFFMLGYLIESYPEAVKAMVAGGHQIASHSYDHPNLAESNQDKAYNQIMTTENLLSEIDGKNGHYIRCPYGSANDYVKSIAPGPLIHWSVDTEDWSSRNADAVYSAIMNNVYDGCIILCHDIYDTTRAGVLRAIPDLKAAGYELVTVEELLKRRNVDIHNGETYFYGLNEGTNYPKGVVELTFGSFAESKQEKTYVLPEPAQ